MAILSDGCAAAVIRADELTAQIADLRDRLNGPLAIAKVASIKLSSSSNTPLSRSSLATSVSTRRNTSLLHQV